LTLTDKSSKVKQGCKGDATILKPTVIVSVPLILDRIYKGIQSKIENGPSFKKAIFDFGVQYKLYWYNKGYGTPILDRYATFEHIF
jgi:long-chain acyl-CoA synthetase